MHTRIRLQFLVLLLTLAGLALVTRLVDHEPAAPSMDGDLPIAEFGLDTDAPRPDMLSSEDQQKAIEQAMTNMWEWLPDYERHKPEPVAVSDDNGMIAFRKMPEDKFYLTDPEGVTYYGLGTHLPTVHNFEWSPDDKSIAFISQTELGSYCVYRADLETDEYKSLACGFHEAYEPRWSPDGSRLVFHGRQTAEDNSRVWFVSSNGGQPTELAADLSIAYTPSWLDNDIVLLSGRVDDRAWAIYRVDIDQPNATVSITPPFNPSDCEGTFAIYPEISPDKKLVAFAAARSSGSSKSAVCYASVYTVDPMGIEDPAKKADIASTAETNHGRYGRLRWNPQGVRVGIMGSGDNNILRLYVVNTADGETDELEALQDGSFSVWEWSPDGTQMAGGHLPEGGAWSLYRIDPNGEPDIFIDIQDGLDPAWSSRPPDQPVDLEATGLEITQAIQNLENTLPLVEKKLTWVRLSVRSSPSEIDNVSAKLIITRDGIQIREIHPVNVRIRVTPDGSDRAKLETTFNFMLPLDLSQGKIGIRAEVGPGQEIYESDYVNNLYPRESEPPVILDFTARSGMIYDSYRLVISRQNGTKAVISHADADELLSYIEAAYPISSAQPVLVDEGEKEIDLDNFDPTTLTGENSWAKLHARVAPWCNATGISRCIFWIPPEFEPTYGYRGYASGNSIIMFANPNYGNMVAHEIGHTFSLGDLVGNPTGNPPVPCTHIDDFGLRKTERELSVYPPASYFNFMEQRSGCGILGGNQWVTKVIYQHLFNRLAPTPNERLNYLFETYMVVSGFLIPGVSSELNNIYDVSRPAGYSDEPGEGLYRIDLLDSNGQLLFTRNFSGGTIDGDLPGTAVLFYETMPRPTGVDRVVLWDESGPRDELVASNYTPSVTGPPALEGLIIDEPTLMSWSGVDEDGDQLSYSVEYSPDGGETWLVLDANLKVPSYLFDPTYLPGTSQGKLRVRASDGLNTAESVSDGFFSVPPHAPSVDLLSPRPGRHPTWIQVELVASAYDREDGALPDSAFAWSVDGEPVGVGAIKSLFDLATGDHVVSLTVTDSDGQTATVQSDITITDYPVQLFMPVALYTQQN